MFPAEEPPAPSKRSYGLLLTLAGYGLSPVLGLMTSIFAARFLGIAGRGELTAITALPSLLVAVATFGMGYTVPFFVARNPKIGDEVLGTAFAISGLASLVAIGIGVPLQIIALHEYSFDLRKTGIIYLALIPLTVLVGTPWGVPQGLGRFKLFNVLRVIPQFLYMLSIFAMGSLFGRSTVVVKCYLILILIIAAPLSWIGFRYCGFKRVVFRKKLFLKMLRYGGISFTGSFPALLNQRCDQVILAGMLSAKELGLYATAAAFSLALTPIVSGVGAYFLPQFALMSESGGRRALWRIFFKVALWSIATAIVLMLLIPSLIPLLFGHAFDEATRPAIFLTGGGTILAFNIFLEDASRGTNRPVFSSIAEISGVSAMVGALIFLVPRYGLMGAVYASIVGYSCSFILLVFLLTRRKPVEPEINQTLGRRQM